MTAGRQSPECVRVYVLRWGGIPTHSGMLGSCRLLSNFSQTHCFMPNTTCAAKKTLTMCTLQKPTHTLIITHRHVPCCTRLSACTVPSRQLARRRGRPPCCYRLVPHGSIAGACKGVAQPGSQLRNRPRCSRTGPRQGPLSVF